MVNSSPRMAVASGEYSSFERARSRPSVRMKAYGAGRPAERYLPRDLKAPARSITMRVPVVLLASTVVPEASR